MTARRSLTGIAAIAAISTLTACAAQSLAAGHAAGAGAGRAHNGGTAQLRPAQGTVTGRLVREGGPLGPGGQQPATRPISGVIQFISPSGQVTRVKVGRSGAFTVTLVPGTYRVRGSSPAVVEVGSADIGGKATQPPCTIPKTVKVTDRRTIRITLACVVP
jgi:hypothetical protein